MFKRKSKLLFLMIYMISFVNAKNISLNEKCILIISLYNETNCERLNEYLICLEKNLKNSAIEFIHVMYDTSKDDIHNELLKILKNHSSLKITYLKDRPTFDYIFTLTNELYRNRKIIISNADIYFDETLNLLSSYDLKDKLLSLTRWDVLVDGTTKPGFLNEHGYGYGADTWIYESPIKKIDNLNIGLGTLGCDHAVIFQALKSKFIVLNPCLDIKCFHMHLSKVRNYNIYAKYPEYPMSWMHAGRLSDSIGQAVTIQE